MSPDNDKQRLLNFRPLFAAAVGLMMGIAFCAAVTGVGLPARQTPLWLRILSYALPAAVGALAVCGAVTRSRWLFVVSAAFLVGAARLFIAVPDSVEAEQAIVTGTVSSVEYTDSGAELTLINASCSGERLSYGVRVTVKAGEGDELTALSVRLGEGASVLCQSVSVPTRRFNNYNERLARLAEGVSLNAAAYEEDVVSIPEAGSPFLKASGRAVAAVRNVIDRLFGKNAPLVAAFLIGQKDSVPDSVYEDFVSSGAAHLLTLSGFHVGLFTALLFLLLPKGLRWGRFFVICAFLLVYCAAMGFRASLVRASVMCACTLLAAAVDRRADVLSSLSLAALILLLFDPYKIFSVGFQLSFAAALGIVLVNSYGGARTGVPMLNKLIGTGLCTLGATAASLLFTARYFGVFYTCAVFVNIICVPLFSVAVTMCFVLTLAGFFLPNTCFLLAKVPNALINAALWLLKSVARLPFAAVTAYRPSAICCVLLLMSLFAVSAFVLRPPKTRIKYAAILLALFTAGTFADIIRA